MFDQAALVLLARFDGTEGGPIFPKSTWAEWGKPGNNLAFRACLDERNTRPSSFGALCGRSRRRTIDEIRRARCPLRLPGFLWSGVLRVTGNCKPSEALVERPRNKVSGRATGQHWNRNLGEGAQVDPTRLIRDKAMLQGVGGMKIALVADSKAHSSVYLKVRGFNNIPVAPADE
jgi:hypothetical protein